mgnify:FL=1
MIKLINGEIKKIFLKPAIFVITALLVFALTLSIFIYKPAKRNDTVVSVSGTTVGQMYDASFGSTQPTNTLSKNYLQTTYVNSSTNIINFYLNQIENEEISKKQELLNKLKSIKTGSYQNYRKKVFNSGADEDLTAKENLRNAFKTDLVDFNDLYTSYINGSNGFYYLLLSSSDKNDLDVFLTSCLSRPFTASITHTATINEVEENGLNIFINLENYINKMEVFSPLKEDLETAKTNLEKGIENTQKIEEEIIAYKNENPSEKSLEAKKEFNKLITRYQQANENIYNLTLATINSSALKDLSDNEIQNFYQFSNYEYKTKYLINEQKNICKYYLETNKYAFEYANPLSLSVTSNFETNAYDFMYFALEICSFIIIVYVVFLGATMITGEYASGTMKLLAIRPYSRRKILGSKLLATILVGLIFLLITFIITFITGGILFGFASMPMLLIFNATSVTSLSPILVILILFICKTIEITFYAIFSLAISTLFKSNAGSIVVAILVYFASFVLSVFSANIGVLKILPFVNTNLFAYFGSHLVSQSNNLLANMFSRIIGNDMTFFISFAIITIFSAIIYFLTSYIFRTRDIK